MKGGIKLGLDGKDIEYEILLKRIYPTQIEAKRNGASASHIKNLAYTYFNSNIPGLSNYGDQLTKVMSYLTKAIDILLRWDLSLIEIRQVKKNKRMLQHVTNHTQLYPIIENLLHITDRFFTRSNNVPTIL